MNLRLKIKYFLVAVILAVAVFFTTHRFYSVPEILTNNKVIDSRQSVSVNSFLRVGNATVFVETATSSSAIEKGLSGRKSLADNHGMLFIFPEPGRYNFWMPDMRFPIDIIWINSEKVVVGIARNASPEFNPENPVFYTPPAPIKYALEVNAGFADANNVKIGERVIFSPSLSF